MKYNTKVSAAIAAILSEASAIAYGATPSNDTVTATTQLQEVIVTATRREQNVQDVPYNISAYQADTIDKASIKDLQGLTHLIPGLAAPDLGARATSTNSQFIIRGLNASDAGASYVTPNLSVPLVSTYIDDVPMFVNLTLSDIDRVEVLRGPQGTLYGSGAVGGTVRLLHKLPDFSAFSAEVSSDVSNTENAHNPSYSVSGIVNIPFGEHLAMRASAGYERLAGFVNADRAAVINANGQPVLSDPAHPLTSGVQLSQERGVDRSDSAFFRTVLEWKATDAIDMQFSYQRQDDFANGFSARAVGSTEFVVHDFIPHQPIHRQVDLGALTASEDLGFATVTSSSSFYNNRYHDTVDLSYFPENASVFTYFGYPRVVSPIFTYSDDKAFAQEIRVVSKSGGNWDYVAGAFYRRQTTFVTDPQTLPGFAAWSELPGSGDPVNTALGTPGQFSTAAQAVALYNGGARPNSLSPTDLVYDLTRMTTFHDKALYGELTRHLTARWQVTGGARVFWQDFGQDLYQITPICGLACSTEAPPDALGSVRQTASRSFHDKIFKLNSSFELTDTSRVYATWAQGFRHGGANAFPIDPSGHCAVCELSNALVPYKSDTATNYELGIKGTMAGRVRYSAAVYRIDWNNIQLDTFLIRSFVGVVINGGQARTQGVELELDAQLSERWSGTLGFGYTAANLTSNFMNQQFAGRDGDRLPGVSRAQIAGALDYSHPFGNRALTFHLDGAYRSDFTSTVNDLVYNAPSFVSDPRSNYRVFQGFAIVNTSVGLQLNDRLRVRAFVNNVANAAGVTAWVGDHVGAALQDNYEYLSRPRTVGIAIRYSIQ